MVVLLAYLVPHLLALLLQLPDVRAGACLVEVPYGLVGHLLGLLEDLPGLLVGLPEDPVLGLVDLVVLLLELLLEDADALLMPGDFQLLLLDGDPALLQVGDYVLEGLVLLADLFPGGVYDLLRQPQLGGDGEGVALPGDADQQPVGGLQGLHVELAAGILHKGGGEGVDLQLAVVGGGHGADAPVVEVVQHRDGQGRALGGVCPRPQLIEEAERIRVRMVQDVDDALHMGGEGGQALLDALLVPDVRVHFRKNG